MDSGDEILEGGVLAASEHPDDASTVSLWLARRDGRPLVIQESDELSINLTELAKAAKWTPQVEVSGEITAPPSPGAAWEYVSSAGAERIYQPKAPGDPVGRLVIRLGGLAARQSVKATVPVRLTLGRQRHEVRVPIGLSAAPPRITTFRARPSIVVKGRRVAFDVVCEHAPSWSIEEIRDGAATTVASSVSVEASTHANTLGRVTYRLTAKNESDVQQTASVPVNVVAREGWEPAGNWWDPRQVGSLCASPEGDALYALVRSKDAAFIWWSADGFDRWDELVRAPEDMVTTAPGVCVRLGTRRTLIFAGGSTVDHRLTSNRVWTLDVEARTWTSTQAPWTPRMGHACVVTRDAAGVDRIWVIGGANASGTTLSDVQVSVDGAAWEPRPDPGWNADRPKGPAAGRGRCMFGATAVGSEIWIGGGFEEPFGKSIDDVWRWDTGQKEARPLRTADGVTGGDAWRLTAFALVSLDAHVWIAGVERRTHPAPTRYQAIFFPRANDASGDVVPEGGAQVPWLAEAQVENARIEAVAFNGCIWVVVQRDAGDSTVGASSLFCFVPSPRGSVQ